MNGSESPPYFLIGLLGFLIIFSGFFSSSETSMMSLNRYRLKHMARKKHPGAARASRLLEEPDKLLGVILIGNNFVNLLAASIATTISIQIFGNPETVLTTVFLTLMILIFGEITPKTIAALYPEKLAFPFSWFLLALLKVLYPLVWMANVVSNRLIRLLGFNPYAEGTEQLSPEELRTVVYESAGAIPARRQGMLLNILDLEHVTVNDILVPRNDILGLDLADELDDIISQVGNSQHTRLPVFRDNIENLVGVLHLRNIGKLLKLEVITKEALIQACDRSYFIPESTPLHTQLFNFQNKKRRLAFVVDEYGALQGIVTLEDILEEIVGEFTTDMAASNRDIHPQNDGTFLIDGGASLREINKTLSWNLDSSNAKTLNGLLMELLESIPEAPVGVTVGDYHAEILQTKDKVIKTVKMWPREEDETENSFEDES